MSASASVGRLAWLLGAVLLGTGCGVPLEGTTTPLTNECSADADCGSSGVCRESMCVSTVADLPDVVLQIQLPTTAPYGAGSSTLLDPEGAGVLLQGEDPLGFWLAHDLVVPPLVRISNARLQVSPAPEGCVAAADGSVPIAVQLQPAEAPVGLPLPIYSGKSSLVGEGLDARYECALEVPAGAYDVFLQVDRGSAEDDPNASCALPPVLLTGHELVGEELAINVSVAAPTHLTGVVAGLSSNVDLAGWTIELVENGDGRPISTSQTFGRHALGSSASQDAAGPGGLPAATVGGSAPAPAVPFDVAFWPELVADALIRLTPPADSTAMPTLLWRLSAVDLDGDFHVGLDLTALASASALLIEGTVLDETAGTGVGATITIQSQELLGGEFGANAAYRTTADAGATGRFSTHLLPGTYKVVAVPGGDPSRAITDTTWQINPNDLGGGRTIVLNPRGSLRGDVRTPAGEPAFDVSCYVQPATSPALPYLEELLSTYDVLPNTATALTTPEGGFAVPVDPGTFDFAVRPDETSGFPWLVRGNVVISPTEEAAVEDLGPLALSNPVVFAGRVRSSTGTGLGGAIIRAWLPVYAEDTSEDERPTVVQLGRAVSAPDGSYRLLLPAAEAR